MEKGEGGARGGGRTVIKMRAEEKAHVRNKQKCVLTKAQVCVRGACVCVCLFMALSYPRCAVCLRGIRGDPCATGIYNRPAGPSLCDDKALGVLCRASVCARLHECVYPSRLFSIGASVYESGEPLINHI